MQPSKTRASTDSSKVAALPGAVLARRPYEAFELLEPESDAIVASVLATENPAIAGEVPWELPKERRRAILAAASAELVL